MTDGRMPIHYTVQGEGSPIVLIHGGLSNGTLAWSRTADALAAHHRVIVVDRRGHGKSPRDPMPYSIASDAVDTLQVADELGLAAFHVVGHSYGGLVSLEMTRKAPNRVATLHLIEPPLLSILLDDPQVKAMIDASRHIWDQASRWPDEQIATEFLSLVAGPDFVTMAQAWPVWSVLVREAGRLPNEQNPSDYQLGPPHPGAAGGTFIYTGGLSHPALRKVARALAVHLPKAQLMEFSKAYHEVHKIGEPFERALLSITTTPDL